MGERSSRMVLLANRLTGALEPGTVWYIDPSSQNAGGYHNSRNRLRAIGRGNDYSLRLPGDQGGDGNKYCALDWVFPTAQRGSFAQIRKYGNRIRAAYERRDPRLTGWREVLIRTDRGIEGFDFQGWFIRTPDDTHGWHGHFSVLRENVDIAAVYENMESILAGESLDAWRARLGGNGAKRKARGMVIEYINNGSSSYWISDGVHCRTFMKWDSVEAWEAVYGPRRVVTSKDAFEDLAGRQV